VPVPPDVQSFRVFAGIAPETAQAIQNSLVERAVARGAAVFREGDRCEGLFLLAKGRVKLLKTSYDRHELALAIIHEGDSFDLGPVFDDGPQCLSAWAIDGATLYVLPKDDVLRLADDHADMAVALLTGAFGLLQQLTRLVEHVSSRSVTARLALFLLDRAAHDEHVALDISQREVAALLGTRREVMARALARMRQDGILSAGYPRLTILDRNRLSYLAAEAS